MSARTRASSATIPPRGYQEVSLSEGAQALLRHHASTSTQPRFRVGYALGSTPLFTHHSRWYSTLIEAQQHAADIADFGTVLHIESEDGDELSWTG